MAIRSIAIGLAALLPGLALAQPVTTEETEPMEPAPLEGAPPEASEVAGSDSDSETPEEGFGETDRAAERLEELDAEPEPNLALDPVVERWTTDTRALTPNRAYPARAILRFPATFAELAFTPLYPLLYAVDRWQLLPRALDLFTNDAKTFAVIPIVEPFGRSGPGLGAAMAYNNPLGSADRLVLLGLYRTNGDITTSLSFSRRIPSLSGRVLSISGGYDLNHDLQYRGLGEDRNLNERRSIRVEGGDAKVGFTIFGNADTDFRASTDARYRFRRLGPGTPDGLQFNDVIRAPAGFGLALNYLEGGINLSYDTRDSRGKTTRGVVLELDTLVAHDLDGAQTGGLRMTGKGQFFIQLLPINRVLVLTLAGTATAPLSDEDRVPLHMLVSLGGNSRLRGYAANRFNGRHGWWGSAEYRWEVTKYGGTRANLSASLFVDVGNVGGDFDDLIERSIPYSVGMGLRLEGPLLALGMLQFAYSPDGFRVSVRLGEAP